VFTPEIDEKPLIYTTLFNLEYVFLSHHEPPQPNADDGEPEAVRPMSAGWIAFAALAAVVGVLIIGLVVVGCVAWVRRWRAVPVVIPVE
jgi:hypothetical protein